MAIRFDAATDRLSATGFSGTVAVVTWWSYLSADRNAFINFWILHNGSEGAPEAGVGSESGGDTIVTYDTGYVNNITGPTPGVGNWYRYALRMNGTAWTFYWGAAGSALSSAGATCTALSSPSTLHLGASGDWFNGRHANFKIYTADLVEPEIEIELRNYKPQRTANLNRWYPLLNAGDLNDYSGNGSNLTAGSTAVTTEDGPPTRWGRTRYPRVTLSAAAAPAPTPPFVSQYSSYY